MDQGPSAKRQKLYHTQNKSVFYDQKEFVFNTISFHKYNHIVFDRDYFSFVIDEYIDTMTGNIYNSFMDDNGHLLFINKKCLMEFYEEKTKNVKLDHNTQFYTLVVHDGKLYVSNTSVDNEILIREIMDVDIRDNLSNLLPEYLYDVGSRYQDTVMKDYMEVENENENEKDYSESYIT